MKKLSFLLLLVAATVFAATNYERITTRDFAVIGAKNSTENKGILFEKGDGTLVHLRANFSEERMEQSFDDGVTFEALGAGGSGSSSGGINLIGNSSFEEADSPLKNWSNTGGTLTQETYVNGRDGDESFARFVSTVAGETLESDLVIVSDSLGNGCMADIYYSQGDSAFEYKVLNNSLDVLATGSFNDISIGWRKAPTLTLPCPDPGDSYKLVIESLAAGTIDLDTAYLGSNKGFISGTYFNSFTESGNSGEVVGAATKTPFGSSNNKGWSGDTYTVQRSNSVVEIKFSTDFTAGATRAYSLYKNGLNYRWIGSVTNTSVHPVTYISTAGEFLKDDEISIRLNQGSGTLNNTPAQHYININERSGETQEAYNPDQVNFTKKTAIFYKSNNTTQTVSTGPMLVTSVGNVGVIEGDGFSELCSSTESSVAGNCVTNTVTGFEYDIPIAGKVEVCASLIVDGNGTVSAHKLVMVDNSDTNVIIEDRNPHSGAESGNWGSVSMCEIFNINSVGKYSFALYSGSGGSSQLLIANIAGTQYFHGHVLQFSIGPVSHNISKPLTDNMTDSFNLRGSKKGSCVIQRTGGSTSFDITDGDCSFIVSTVSCGSGCNTITTDTTGYKCQCSPMDTGDCGFTTGAGGQITASSFPNPFRVYSYTTTATSDDKSISLSCSRNR